MDYITSGKRAAHAIDSCSDAAVTNAVTCQLTRSYLTIHFNVTLVGANQPSENVCCELSELLSADLKFKVC